MRGSAAYVTSGARFVESSHNLEDACGVSMMGLRAIRGNNTLVVRFGTSARPGSNRDQNPLEIGCTAR